MDELTSIKSAVGLVDQLCEKLVERMRAAVELSRAVGNKAELQAETRHQVGGEIDEAVRSAQGVGHHAASVGQASSSLLRQAASLRERVRRAAA